MLWEAGKRGALKIPSHSVKSQVTSRLRRRYEGVKGSHTPSLLGRVAQVSRPLSSLKEIVRTTTDRARQFPQHDFAQEGLPALQGRSPDSRHVLADGRFGDFEPKHAQFGADTWCDPTTGSHNSCAESTYEAPGRLSFDHQGCENDKQSAIDLSRRKGIVEFDPIIIGAGVSGFAASIISVASA